MSNSKLKLTVEIYGDDEYDLTAALDEVIKSINEGNTIDFEENKPGSYKFNIDEVEENE